VHWEVAFNVPDVSPASTMTVASVSALIVTLPLLWGGVIRKLGTTPCTKRFSPACSARLEWRAKL